jgi:hypothetical protein
VITNYFIVGGYFMSNKVEHLVLFRFKEGTTQEQKLKLIDISKSLSSIIDGREAISVGVNTTEEVELKHGYSVGMRMMFRDLDALRGYRVHPEHEKLVKFSQTIVDKVVVVDLEI